MGEKMGKKFNRLEHRIAAEYRRKGISSAVAEEWGKATAGKVWREKMARRKKMPRSLHTHFAGR